MPGDLGKREFEVTGKKREEMEGWRRDSEEQ